MSPSEGAVQPRILAVALAFTLSISGAARGEGGSAGTKAPGGVLFDPATVVTISGTLLGEQRTVTRGGETLVVLDAAGKPVRATGSGP